jgi:predicted nucleic-acid-binding protein
MLGLDSNVLLRYVVRDHPEQAGIAARIIEEECSPERPGFVNHMVLCEFVWSLETSYRYRREQIAEVLATLLRIDRIALQSEEEVVEALNAFASGNADFADALIAGFNRRHGCTETCTFDRAAARLPGMRHARGLPRHPQ